MTVIAYRDGVLASDSYVIQDGRFRVGNFQKIYRVTDDDGQSFLVGTSGSVHDCVKFRDWFESGEDDSFNPEDPFAAIVVNEKTGKVVHYEGDTPMEIDNPYHATGYGAPLALAAMAAGVGAEEAVKAACVIDVSLGGPIQVLKIEPQKPKRKRG